jgi:hypothetical protein
MWRGRFLVILHGERKIFGYPTWGEGDSQISFEGRGKYKKYNFLIIINKVLLGEVVS